MSGVRVSSLELLSLFVWRLTLIGGILGDENGLDVVKVMVKEGNDAILPCSLDTVENIESKLFDWRMNGQKDGRKEVFLYDAGIHYNNGRPGQDEQFKGRVSHFPDELKNGNASIIIRNTTEADSGNYTCIFPRLRPERRFHIQLVVDLPLKDRSGEHKGVVSEPYIRIFDQTEDGTLLQCVVRGASPKPKVQWQDSAGNIVPAYEPQVSERGGRYDITLQTTVTKADSYSCVATQEEIKHVTAAQTFVNIHGKECEDSSSKVVTGWLLLSAFLGALALAVVQALLVAANCIRIGRVTSSRHPSNEYSAAPVNPPA